MLEDICVPATDCDFSLHKHLSHVDAIRQKHGEMILELRVLLDKSEMCLEVVRNLVTVGP